MTRRKAGGPDNVKTEMYLLPTLEGGKMLLDFLNHIYYSGEIPGRWNQSNFITVPRKSYATVFEAFRTISLFSQGLKILLTILLTRTSLVLY